MGSEMRMLAFISHIYVLTGSKLSLGLIGACRCVPVLVFGLWGGVSADRFDRRRVLIATQAFMACVSSALFVLTRAGLITPLIIYAAIALIATTAAFENPARSSFVVNVLPKEDLENGLALNVLGWQVATVLGPAVGGLLVGHVDPKAPALASIETLYALDALSFVPLIGVLFFIRARVEDAPLLRPEKPASGVAQIADALRFLRTQPALIHLMWIDFLATLFAGALLLLPVFSNEIFGYPDGLGWLMSAPAAGSVIAGAIISSRAPIRRHGPVLLVAIAAYGVATALFGLTSSFWIGVVLLAASGAADTVSTVVRQVARQTMIPDEMRGRLNAIHMLFFVSGPQLGELEAGALAEVTSVRTAVVSGGLACVGLAVAASALSPAVRRLRIARPEGETFRA